MPAEVRVVLPAGEEARRHWSIPETNIRLHFYGGIKANIGLHEFQFGTAEKRRHVDAGKGVPLQVDMLQALAVAKRRKVELSEVIVIQSQKPQALASSQRRQIDLTQVVPPEVEFLQARTGAKWTQVNRGQPWSLMDPVG